MMKSFGKDLGQRLLPGLIALAVVVGGVFVYAPAVSSDSVAYASTASNKTAHKVLLKSVKKIHKRNVKEWFYTVKTWYKFIDLTGDGIDECITNTTAGGPSRHIYTYRNGKAVEVFNNWHFTGGPVKYFYKATSVIVNIEKKAGYRYVTYCKYNGKRFESVCWSSEEKTDAFCVKGTWVSRSKFNAYAKKLKKGKKITFDESKWKRVTV